MNNIQVTSARFVSITRKDKIIRLFLFNVRKWYMQPRMWLLILTIMIGTSVVATIIVVLNILVRRNTLSATRASTLNSVGKYDEIEIFLCK